MTKRLKLLMVFGLVTGVFSQLPAQTFTKDERGIAIYYAAYLDNEPTAYGEIYRKTEMTASHPYHPPGTMLKVTRLDNNLSVNVRVNDRGPFCHGCIVDLSLAAADKIDLIKIGKAMVSVEVIGKQPANQVTAGNSVTRQEISPYQSTSSVMPANRHSSYPRPGVTARSAAPNYTPTEAYPNNSAGSYADPSSGFGRSGEIKPYTPPTSNGYSAANPYTLPANSANSQALPAYSNNEGSKIVPYTPPTASFNNTQSKGASPYNASSDYGSRQESKIVPYTPPSSSYSGNQNSSVNPYNPQTDYGSQNSSVNSYSVPVSNNTNPSTEPNFATISPNYLSTQTSTANPIPTPQERKLNAYQEINAFNTYNYHNSQRQEARSGSTNTDANTGQSVYERLRARGLLPEGSAKDNGAPAYQAPTQMAPAPPSPAPPATQQPVANQTVKSPGLAAGNSNPSAYIHLNNTGTSAKSPNHVVGEAPAPESVDKTITAGKFALQFASYTQSINAHRQLEHLKKVGVPKAYIMETRKDGQKLYKLVAGPYTDYRVANGELERYKKEHMLDGIVIFLD